MSPVVLWSSTCGMQQVRRGRRVIPLWNLGGRVAEQVLMRYLASFIVSTGNSARRRRQTRGALTASLTYSIHRLDPLGALSGASNGSSDHLDEARTLPKDLARRRHNFPTGHHQSRNEKLSRRSGFNLASVRRHAIC
jgi:hypothetical protein